MKAMIFAAGRGTRLKPLTDAMPKALVAIEGKPMLEHLILRLKAAGCSHLVINIHHFGRQIVDFLASKNDFGLRIDISDECSRLADTGGGLRQAARFLEGNEPFLVHNVDIFSNADLKAMYRHHARSDAMATLLVSNRPSARRLLFDNEDRLCGWRNRETGEIRPPRPDFDPSACAEHAFGGIHVISPGIFPRMSDWAETFSIMDFYLSVCSQIPVRPYRMEGLQLIDAGKPESLAEAAQWIKKYGESNF
jgi:NDP-sugar pyrophosphorylase family protein